MSVDYEEANEILIRIESTFSELITELELDSYDIEKWAWDEPSITLSWEDVDVDKNIHVYIQQDNSDVEIEVNAWVDLSIKEILNPYFDMPSQLETPSETDLEGAQLVRLWHHEPVAEVEAEPGNVNYNIWEKAIPQAQNLGFDDLDNQELLKK